MKERRSIIYGLIDPRSRLIFYVGLSKHGLSRPEQHRQRGRAKGELLRAHLDELWAQGLDFEIVVLEDEPVGQLCWWRKGSSSLPDAERWWVAYGRACGWPLTNMTDGGEGARNPHPLTRKRMSDAKKGKNNPATPRRRLALQRSWDLDDGTRRRKTSDVAKARGRREHDDATFADGLCALLAAGVTHGSAAKLLGLGRTSVAIWLRFEAKHVGVERCRAPNGRSSGHLTLHPTGRPLGRPDVSDEAVFVLLASGIPQGTVATLLGVTRSVIVGREAAARREQDVTRSRRLPHTPANQSAITDAQVAALRALGLSLREVADALGCTLSLLKTRQHMQRVRAGLSRPAAPRGPRRRRARGAKTTHGDATDKTTRVGRRIGPSR